MSALLWSTIGPVAELEGVAGTRRDEAASARPLPILPVIAHQDRLLGPFLAWATAIARDGVLSRRESELLALRTAANCRSDFEWQHHAVFASAAGMTGEEIERIAAGPDAEGWTPEETALLRAADELHAGATVDDPTWNVLAGRYGAAALVEIILVVGQYTMLSMLANAAGVPTDEG